MRCDCHNLRRKAGWTHLGAGCPDCRTCWACCRCGWSPTDQAAAAELHPDDLLAEAVAEIHARAAPHHCNVKSRMDGWKAGPRPGDLSA
jgi:hypothetical protein